MKEINLNESHSFQYISHFSNTIPLNTQHLSIKLKIKGGYGHFCLEPISPDQIHHCETKNDMEKDETLKLQHHKMKNINSTSLFSTVLVTTVQTQKIPFWMCLGPQWQVCEADEQIDTYFTRWASNRLPNGDSLSAWILQWPDNTRALLYGHALPGQPFRIFCSLLFHSSKNFTQIIKKNKESLRRLIMAALRLRGIVQTHYEFKKLYQHTWISVLFACRKKIRQQWIPIDEQRWIIERFIGTFLLEEIPSSNSLP